MFPQLIEGDALSKLAELESESVDCCITSPPYWALRDYKTEGQLGLEPTFAEYINKLVTIFDEVKRVLKKTGTCWIVIGDTYNETKSVTMIPERLAIAMIDHGWILRNKIIWYKPNCMPSSARDRFTVDWEYVYFFSKSQKYFFETQYEPISDYPSTVARNNAKTGREYSKKQRMGMNDNVTYYFKESGYTQNPLGRIKRCVWKISTKPFSGAHFAVFPPDLVQPMIKAGCPQPGIVLDPFMGSGTTGLVALQNARDFIGIELNAEYIEIAKSRLAPFIGQERLIPAI